MSEFPSPAEFRRAALAYPPDARGWFGRFGGRFVPETLMPALLDLDAAFRAAMDDDAFLERWFGLLGDYVGRPSQITLAANLSERVGAEVWLKREDLNHTGAHKINNTLAQALLALRMGKRRVIAETGAGQHGVATATAAALLGLECVVYMGEEDVRRQELNVFRMRMMGAEVRPVASGTRTLKDAMNEALREWVTRVRDTHYIIGSAAGPHPFPWLVRAFQSIIGMEAQRQMRTRNIEPNLVVACVGGGSNSIGLFHAYRDGEAEIVGVEAAGEGVDTERHGASVSRGAPGILHGSLSMLLSTPAGQVQEAHSVSAGLDYPGVGPELAHLHDIGRIRFAAVPDREALDAVQSLARLEGILPALESAHTIAWLLQRPWGEAHRPRVLVGLSGRGDKDVQQVARLLAEVRA